MSHFDCIMCRKKAKRLKKFYQGFETFLAYCQKCEFKWWPLEEEMKVDSKMKHFGEKE